MTHGNTVTHCRNSKDEGLASSFLYSFNQSVHECIEMDVARNHIVPRVSNTDEGFLHVVVRKTGGPEKTSLRSLVDTGFDVVTSHRGIMTKPRFNSIEKMIKIERRGFPRLDFN